MNHYKKYFKNSNLTQNLVKSEAQTMFQKISFKRQINNVND